VATATGRHCRRAISTQLENVQEGAGGRLSAATADSTTRATGGFESQAALPQESNSVKPLALHLPAFLKSVDDPTKPRSTDEVGAGLGW
jgi:hypothetical protein